MSAIGLADLEDSCWSAAIAFAFEVRFTGVRVNATAPGESIFAKSASDWLGDGLPAVSFFLVEGDTDIGGIPAFSGADDELLAL